MKVPIELVGATVIVGLGAMMAMHQLGLLMSEFEDPKKKARG